MSMAWLLTLLAAAGVFGGVFLHESRRVPAYLAAIGGGLLCGIALFRLLPEIALTTGAVAAVAAVLAIAALLVLADRLFSHSGYASGRGIVWPLLAATAFHSFLDGWSIRALAAQPLAGVAVLVGLALHKIPEGLAIGWITRRSTSSRWRAALAAIGAEGFTLVGAFAQPAMNRSGLAQFGIWWTSGVLALIGGSFLFLGGHTLWPHVKRPGVVAVFLVALLLVWIADQAAGCCL
jgi:zinc and cadmium transporter